MIRGVAAAALGCFVAVGCISEDPGTDPDPGGPTAQKWIWAAGSSTIRDARDGDSECEDDLRGRKPGGRAIAWVVHDGVSPVDRMGAADGPWYSPGGALIASSRAALLAPSLARGVTEDVHGRSVDGRVWTGLLPDGGPSGFDCAGWSEMFGDASATVGLLGATSGAWATLPERESCLENSLRLVCLEL